MKKRSPAMAGYVSILNRQITQPSGVRCVFEIDSYMIPFANARPNGRESFPLKMGFISRMRIYDDIFNWEGFGGALRLGSGKCRLRIYDLREGEAGGLTYLKPFVIIVSDVADSKMSVRSCAGHVATRVTQTFRIDPHRMIFIEYYPSKKYGEQNQHLIPERYEVVEFSWHEDKALHPRWRPLKPPMLDVIQSMMQAVRTTQPLPPDKTQPT